jgi:Ca2+-binding EF-hand superfamily protein
MKSSKKSIIEDIRKSSNKTLIDDVSYKTYQLNNLVKTTMIKEAFHMFDADGSGEIDTNEFEKLVISLGIELDRNKIKELYKEIDSNRSGTIDLVEFTEMMIRYQFNKDNPIEFHLENTFNNYDIGCDGFIDKNDLMRVSKELDEPNTNIDDMDLLIKVMKMFSVRDGIKGNSDPDKVSREEFVYALNKLHFIEEVMKDEKKANETKSSGEILMDK